MTEADNFERFNLQTMSGVFAGSRTQSFQRLRLHAMHGEPLRQIWAQLFWYDEPAQCVLSALDAGDRQKGNGPEILWHSATVDPGTVTKSLQVELEQSGWQLEVCGTCGHWQMEDTHNADGLPIGRCQWGQPSTSPTLGVESVLTQQSSLALACTVWTADRVERDLSRKHGETLQSDTATTRESSGPAGWRGWIAKIARRKHEKETEKSHGTAEEQIEERSGVGAGTEPCPVCRGRIANLGALTLDTTEGDKQTYSLWRCRLCYTTYLNSWIDRWERLDTLETEETLYRLSPRELITARRVIEGVETSANARAQQRDWFVRLVQHRIPLSHQIRQGR